MNHRKKILEHLEDAAASLLAENPAMHIEKPRIAAWGLVKAGKSSLLNMLSGQTTDEYFKTGAIRTTRRNSELETDHYVLVDTPGLGIDEDDSNQAFKGLDSADVILFVHAPQGELDQEETELLTQVKAAYAEETERRLILVLSQLDKDQNRALDSIHWRIMAQLQELIGVQPVCFQVSSTRYKKGASEAKPGLMQKSGIPALAQHLEALSLEIKGDSQLHAVRSSRRQARKAELVKELNQAIEEERRLISDLQRPYAERMHTFNQIMGDLRQSFASHSAEIAAAQQELNSI